VTGFRRSALLVLALGLAASPAAAQPAAGARAHVPEVTYLDDGAIRLGVDLDNGGMITYLARSGPTGADLVHDVQQSYSGEGWHVSAGGGRVTAHSNDGRTIYVRAVPAGPCACTLETWVTLHGAAAYVTNRLTNSGTDLGQGGPASPELPALYTTGTAYRLFTYDGVQPYTGAPIRRISEHAGRFFVPGSSFAATEHWAALVGPGGRGIGLFVPALTRFNGIPGTAAAIDSGGDLVNGYLTATTPEILDSNIVYTYSYVLIVGTVRGIRAYAVAHRPDSRPAYRFDADRRHWWYANAGDQGSPPAGALRVRVDRDDPQLIGPEQWWSTRSAPALYVRGAWHTRYWQSARLTWTTPLGRLDPHTLVFTPVADGRFHTYRLDLRRHYDGIVTGLRLDPVATGGPGEFVDISCISWKPCPADRATENRLASEPLRNAFTETFDGALGPMWHISGSGTGAVVAPAGGRLGVRISPDGQAGPPGGWLGAHIGTNCHLRGDFDVQVDYGLPVWPAASGVAAFMRTYYGPDIDGEGVVRDSEAWGESYGIALHGYGTSTPTGDLSGTLRLVRTGATIAAYYWSAAGWQLISSGAADTGEATITLGAASGPLNFGHQAVEVAYDNFRVNSGLLDCP
jgi:hypothetical protein